ncbi:hypothetical protein GCM10010302_30030 [Streptomyces polychromogenes]|uniref:Uncharacterized protein n=1 Tax=Streptomyces polychromogenes TaxID=67342 RepID=A0ABN0VD68_9ACTN
MRAGIRFRTLTGSVRCAPGSVRHSTGVLAGLALAAGLLLALTDGAAAAATGAALITVVALALGRYAAGGAAQDTGPRGPTRVPGSRAPALGRWRRTVADALADDGGEHLRTVMRPQLQRLFAARLAERHGVALYRNPDRARALVGTDLWPWIDPGSPAPGPTLPEAVLRALLDRLEAL